MDGNISIGVIIFLVLLIVNALLTIAHQALVNARKPHLRQMIDGGQAGGTRALALAEDPARLIASLQLGVTLMHFLAAAVMVFTVFPPLNQALIDAGLDANLVLILFFVIVIPLAAVVTLLLGDMLPSAIAVRHAEGIAIAVTPFLDVLTRILSPIARALIKVSYWLATPFGGERDASSITEEEIMSLVHVGEEEGVIEEEEKVMIHSIFRFADTLVREVMVPRIDIVAISIDTTVEQALEVINRVGHSRIPVYGESIDHIKGILYAKDLLSLWQQDREHGQEESVTVEMLRPVYFIPEAKKAFDLLEELQQRKVHIAIVVDEYGGTAGLVTIEDLIEEIVGEIQDEYDYNEEAVFEKIDEDEYIFDGRIDLDDLNQILECDLPTDTADTLGGYIFSVLERLPEIGERFDAENLELEILGVTGRRIQKVHVRRLRPALEDSRGEMDASPD